MKISYEWLKKYIDLDRTPAEVEEALTLIGFEVEEVVELGLPDLPKVVVGEVLTREQHPNADRLSVCQVKIDAEGTEARIVCGAQNYQIGDRVPVALPGAILPGNFKIKKSKLRGEISEGMMCSGKELGLSEDGEGLLILEQRPEPGTPINEVFPDSDSIFDVEVTPNRPDCLSHLGIARELSAYFGLELRYPHTETNFGTADKEKAENLLESVTIESEKNCSQYTMHLIQGVKIGPSPDWLLRAIEAIGMRPVNNVVDVTNYVLYELGQPLHAFDVAKIRGRKIIIRQAKKGEKIVTLDEKERSLTEEMLVIADAERPLVLAGIMGSIDAEVDETTTDIALESAYFEPSSIRRTSKMVGLSSDSSYRFERGVDPFNLKFAAERAVDLIIEVAGGEFVGPIFESGSEPIIRNEIRIDHSYIGEKAGFLIDADRIDEIFGSLELDARREIIDGEVIWTVQVPGFRGDLDSPIDLVEEIIRIYGTDKIPPASVEVRGIIADDHPSFRYNHRASAYLVGQRFVECLNYTLRPVEELRNWFSEKSEKFLALENPLSGDQSHLRWSLIPGLLDNIVLNQGRKTGAMRYFETGRIFRDWGGEICELNAVAFCIVNDEKSDGWLVREPADFYHAKSHVEALAKLAGYDLSEADFGPVSSEDRSWQVGHSASVGGFADGYQAEMGLLSPLLLKERGIDGSIIAGIFFFPSDSLPEEKVPVFRSFSPYPAAERDLGIVANREVPAATLRRALMKISKEVVGNAFQIESIEPFDVYQGKGLPEGKKSIAFSLKFRSPERTLTDQEVNQAFNTIQKRLIDETEFSVRH